MRSEAKPKPKLRCLLLVVVLLAGTAGCCFLLPDVVFRLQYGRPPLEEERFGPETIKPGMTFDEVRGILGEPHEKYPARREVEGEVWLYWTDSLQIGFFGIRFSEEGRVLSTWV